MVSIRETFGTLSERVTFTPTKGNDYLEKININSVNENKTFWRRVKPFFTDKNKKNGKIILVEDNEIVTDNIKNTEIVKLLQII